MPIIHKVGRRHIQTRILIGAIYLILCVGAITMLYPFGLMIGGSTKSSVDQKELNIFPRFLSDDAILYRKYLEGLFNERLTMLQAVYDEDLPSFQVAEPPEQVNDALIDAYVSFIDQLGNDTFVYSVGFLEARNTRGLHMKVLREFIDTLRSEFDGNIDAANLAMKTHFADWHTVHIQPEIPLERFQRLGDHPLAIRFRELKEQQPPYYRTYFSIEGMFKHMFLKPQYTRNIEAYNETHQTAYPSYDKIFLPRRVPQGTALEVGDWERFIRQALHTRWIQADPEAILPYRTFLKSKYLVIATLNEIYGTTYDSFDQVPLFDQARQSGIAKSDWTSFIREWKDPATGQIHSLPLDMVSIKNLDFQFQDFLHRRHGSIKELNRTLKTNYGSYAEIRQPQKQYHYREFLKNQRSLRWEFTIRNYVTVIQYMLINGRALFNTVVYCSLAILAALIVNPMAAYALSRFSLPSTYKILLLLMVTMAFPPMVTQIPVFLTLRNLDLLNTFWALILPGLANGYLIFILKGFFDSQPKELYECASLDGANEWVMFWQLTMNLSKPVLAYIALQAFVSAYSNFMFALLICQDTKMWTLMPTLYQLQQTAHMGVTFASLMVAAIPTFVVFLFAQNIIMRGIVVPVEK